jgi:hypothetical protein
MGNIIKAKSANVHSITEDDFELVFAHAKEHFNFFNSIISEIIDEKNET